MRPRAARVGQHGTARPALLARSTHHQRLGRRGRAWVCAGPRLHGGRRGGLAIGYLSVIGGNHGDCACLAAPGLATACAQSGAESEW